MHRRSFGVGVTMALLGSALLVTPVTADLIAHPAYVHAGSCAQVGDLWAPLDDVVGEAIGGPALGSPAAIPVESSNTHTVPIAYAHLFASPHSIVVHRGPSAEDLEVYIACGDIGGHEMAPEALAIGLGELNESGYSGIATIHDNGDATVQIAVYITTGHAPTTASVGTTAP